MDAVPASPVKANRKKKKEKKIKSNIVITLTDNKYRTTEIRLLVHHSGLGKESLELPVGLDKLWETGRRGYDLRKCAHSSSSSPIRLTSEVCEVRLYSPQTLAFLVAVAQGQYDSQQFCVDLESKAHALAVKF